MAILKFSGSFYTTYAHAWINLLLFDISDFLFIVDYYYAKFNFQETSIFEIELSKNSP